MLMRQLSPAELKSWLDDPQRAQPVLLDVRESWEFERCHIAGAALSPMSQIQSTFAQLDPARETVVICHHGVRSFHVARFLEHNGFANVINLSGGIDAWAKTVDRQMPTY
jgi:rhodanese-related sulfurtransferase